MQYELLIGLRYTRATRRNHFISFISMTSMLGIALGVWALIVVLSVMNGFQKELRTRILGVASHLQITGPDNRLPEWQDVARRALANPQVEGAAPYVNGQAMLSLDSYVRGTLVRGIVPQEESHVDDIARHMVAGRLDALQPGRYGIVLGGDLARALGARVGDRVLLIAPQGLVTPAGLIPRLRQFTVVGVFNIGYFEYDAGLALVHMADAEQLYQMGSDVSGVRLKLKDLFDAPRVARELTDTLGGDLYISDWTQINANFFRAVQIEKNVMFIILLLIVAVAAFNIVSTLVMAVTDKQADIAILRTLGATPGGIMKIFMVNGTLIGVIGTLIGIGTGVVSALNVDVVVPFIERLFHVQFLSKQVYLITELPSDLHRSDVIAIAVVSLVLSLLATVYPSWRASRVNPAEALRYE